MGIIASFIAQQWPPASHFSVDDIPDLTGKVMIVTGGNTGIGYETIKALVGKNAKVYMGARSKEKAMAAIEKLKADTGKDVLFLQLDLADKQAVKASAAEFKLKETALHVLFNSGGVMMPPLEQITADGYDLQFGTNVVGHYLFTRELIPLLIEGAKTSSDGKARVVNTSSFGHLLSTIDWETVKDGEKRRKVTPNTLYSQSKFGNVVFSNELARRYADKGIVSTSLHPGSIDTELMRHLRKTLPAIGNRIGEMLLHPAPYGALTQLWAGTSPETLNMNGQYFIPWCRVGTPHKEAKDPAIGQKLWEWLEEETGTKTLP